MLGLNETAVLCRNSGRQHGKPVYESPGTSFRCRVERTHRHSAAGDNMEARAAFLIFADAAPGFDPHPGDRIELEGGSVRIAAVTRLSGPGGAHHLEIEATAQL